MRPPIDELAVRMLLQEVPAFTDHYLDLLDIYDDDLTPEIVFMELADMVSSLAASRNDDEMLEDSLSAVENVLTKAPEHSQLIAECFLDQLAAVTYERIEGLLSDKTLQLALTLGFGDRGGRRGGNVVQPLSVAGRADSTASMHL